MPALENQDGPKLNRGEKKARKTLTKLGMKQFAGITRVTIKKRDGLIYRRSIKLTCKQRIHNGQKGRCF